MRKEGWVFKVWKSLKQIFVECKNPEGKTFWIEFRDHRVETHDGKTPHVCDEWLQKKPLLYKAKTLNDEVAESAISAAVLKCILITQIYKEIKKSIFDLKNADG